MRIGSHDTDERVLVIAEIGNNHEGDFGRAREMVEAATEAGVDAVKFQTFRAAELQSRTDAARYARLEGFELTPEQFGELSELTRARGASFLSTPLGLSSVAVCAPICDALKIASGDNTFWPLIDAVAETELPLLVSIGLGDARVVDGVVERIDAVRGIERRGTGLLHCVVSYPTEPADAQLGSIRWLAERYPGTVGYSDHVVGPDAAVLAVAAGARVIEKHFTLEGIESDFRDHELSATPDELSEMIARIRAAEEMTGEGGRPEIGAEAAARPAVRRSICAAADLPAGHLIETADLVWLRPSGGLPPGEENHVVGRRLRESIPAGERIESHMLS